MPSRIRRVKCDEEKPACKRCSSTGRRCDGYLDLGQPSPIGAVSIATGQARTDCEQTSRAAFQFYREMLAPVLSWLGTGSFWSTTVPQACHEHESIKHLVIATSNLRPSPFLDASRREVLFLIHYTEALRLLREARESHVIVILIGYILLTICEEVQQQTSGSYQHLLFGKKILAEYLAVTRLPQRYSEVDEIFHIFSRLSAPRNTEDIRHLLPWIPLMYRQPGLNSTLLNET